MKKFTLNLILLAILLFNHNNIKAQPCGSPINISVTNIKKDSALVSWDVIPGALNYNVRYKKSSDISWNYARTSQINFQLKNLSKISQYDVQVQSDCDQFTMPQYRGLYVNSFQNILGNQTNEDKLLNYAIANRYNYLTLYGVDGINFSNTTNTNNFAAFIKKAKTQYGILQIGVIGESSNFFLQTISPYNRLRTTNFEKVDVYNLEFEFWLTSSNGPGGVYCTKYLSRNGFSCDTTGGFKFYMQELKKIKNIAQQDGMLSEVYVGWFNLGQASQIVAVVDRVLLHCYRVSDSDIYQYAKTRMSYLGSNNKIVNVMPIFSSEPSFMGPYLNTNTITKPFSVFNNYYTVETAPWKSNINIIGYQWFKYSDMPVKTILSTYSTTVNFTTLDSVVIPPVIVCNPDSNEPNNKFSSSKDLTKYLGNNYTIVGNMCPTGDEDWFMYMTNSVQKNLKITVSNLAINVNVEVYDINGNFVAGSYANGLGTETIKINNKPNTKFFVVIYPYNKDELITNSTNYRLNFIRSSNPF